MKSPYDSSKQAQDRRSWFDRPVLRLDEGLATNGEPQIQCLNTVRPFG